MCVVEEVLEHVGGSCGEGENGLEGGERVEEGGVFAEKGTGEVVGSLVGVCAGRANDDFYCMASWGLVSAVVVGVRLEAAVLVGLDFSKRSSL